MIYIRKQPPSVTVEEQLRQAKSASDWKHINTADTEKVRNAFDILNKEVIREQLLKEQKGLCGYCMRRIENDTHSSIEHIIPIESDGEGALDYKNMMLCCDGGRDTDGKPHVLSCDAAKGSTEITVSPYNRDHMKKIRYNHDGQIVIYPHDAAIEHDINDILHLNGVMDENGHVQYDTSTEIVAGRRQAYRAYQTYMKKVSGKKGLKSILEHRRDEIQNAEQYIEYAGVWIYFLNRKLRQLK